MSSLRALHSESDKTVTRLGDAYRGPGVGRPNRAGQRPNPGGFERELSRVARFVSGAPLDSATDARALILRNRAVGEHGIDRRPKVLARHRKAVLRPARVELPTVRELAVGVEEEEVRGAGGRVRLGHILSLVEQVRERVAGL